MKTHRDSTVLLFILWIYRSSLFSDVLFLNIKILRSSSLSSLSRSSGIYSEPIIKSREGESNNVEQVHEIQLDDSVLMFNT